MSDTDKQGDELPDRVIPGPVKIHMEMSEPTPEPVVSIVLRCSRCGGIVQRGACSCDPAPPGSCQLLIERVIR